MTKTNRTRALAVWMPALAMALLTLVGLTPQEAQADFPGKNGKIAFASNRTTGQG